MLTELGGTIRAQEESAQQKPEGDCASHCKFNILDGSVCDLDSKRTMIYLRCMDQWVPFDESRDAGTGSHPRHSTLDKQRGCS
jgi:hypothetical protein